MSEESKQVECRMCKATCVPTPMRDFYVDDVAGPGTGLCETCMMKPHIPREPVAIPQNHEDKACRKGTGATTCLYLSFSCNAGGGWVCAHSSVHAPSLYARAEQGKMRARSINCEGPDKEFKLLETPIRVGPAEE